MLEGEPACQRGRAVSAEVAEAATKPFVESLYSLGGCIFDMLPSYMLPLTSSSGRMVCRDAICWLINHKLSIARQCLQSALWYVL